MGPGKSSSPGPWGWQGEADRGESLGDLTRSRSGCRVWWPSSDGWVWSQRGRPRVSPGVDVESLLCGLCPPLDARLRGLEAIGRVGPGEGTGRSACRRELELAPSQVGVSRLKRAGSGLCPPHEAGSHAAGLGKPAAALEGDMRMARSKARDPFPPSCTSAGATALEEDRLSDPRLRGGCPFGAGNQGPLLPHMGALCCCRWVVGDLRVWVCVAGRQFLESCHPVSVTTPPSWKAHDLGSTGPFPGPSALLVARKMRSPYFGVPSGAPEGLCRQTGSLAPFLKLLTLWGRQKRS